MCAIIFQEWHLLLHKKVVFIQNHHLFNSHPSSKLTTYRSLTESWGENKCHSKNWPTVVNNTWWFGGGDGTRSVTIAIRSTEWSFLILVWRTDARNMDQSWTVFTLMEKVSNEYRGLPTSAPMHWLLRSKSLSLRTTKPAISEFYMNEITWDEFSLKNEQMNLSHYVITKLS